MTTPARQQDRWSEFQALFATHGERVYRWALFMGLDAGSAEEIAQEVFITAMKKNVYPDDDKGQCRWLFQITRKHVANFRRSAWVRRILGFEDDAVPEPTVAAELSDNRYLMQRTLAELPSKWSEVLILHDLDGYTRAEISATLRIAEGTVASRLRHARAAFISKWIEVSDA